MAPGGVFIIITVMADRVYPGSNIRSRSIYINAKF